MKSARSIATALLVALGSFVLSSSVFATNGYFTHGVGTQSKGMAGTGIGSPADMGAIITASNPALGVFVSDDWEAGLALFSPRRSYEASPSQLNGGLIDLGGDVFLPSHTVNPGKVDSSSEYFPDSLHRQKLESRQRRQRHDGVLWSRRHEYRLG